MPDLKLTGAVVAIFAILILFSLCLQSLFLLLGAKIAGIEKRSFWRSFLAVIVGGIASAIFSAVLSAVPVAGPVLAFLGGVAASAFMAMVIFDTTFGKALGATILAAVLGIVILGGLFLLLAMAGAFAAAAG